MSRKKLKRRLKRVGVRFLGEDLPVDFSPAEQATFTAVQPFTLTSPERVVTATRAIEYVQDSNISGAIVECGVWKGGSMMAMARTLLETQPAADRDLHLFDTFEGMSAPTDADRNHVGDSAARLIKQKLSKNETWCYASEAEVRANLESTGYPRERMHFIKGMVENTIPHQAPSEIALLRLDTDWYESTKHELVHLYPRLAPGGVLIIDDYGHWRGAQNAVDEYFEGNVFLQRIDYSGRLVVKR